MKKTIAVAVAGMLFGAGLTAFAGEKFPKHPNLQKAYHALEEATKHISDAQGANEYDLGGHAAKAKDLIASAIGELDQAAATANKK